MAVENHIIRGEHILIGFLRAFFSQDELYDGIANEFQYHDNKKFNSLVIQMTDNFDQESEDAIPSLTIQEGGWQEKNSAMDNNRRINEWSGDEYHSTSMRYQFTIHCVARQKGSSKFLAAATSKGIMAFRKSIYEMGVNKIPALSGSPPQRIERKGNDPGPYDYPIRVPLEMEQDWKYVRGGPPERAVEMNFKATTFDEIEYNDDGSVKTPDDEYYIQDISL